MQPTATVVVKKLINVNTYRADWNDTDVQPLQNAIEETINEIGGIAKFVKPGNRVLVKPNLVCAEPPETANCTDPRVIEAIIRICLKAGAKDVIVGDHPMGKKVPEISGMTRAAERTGTKAVDFNDGDYVSKEFPSAKVLKKADVPRAFYEVDSFINVPKLKTHLACVVTLGLKNLVGLFPTRTLRNYHRDDLHQAIGDMNRLFKPSLTIIDGIIAQEGHAPMYGFPVPEMNTIVAGVDTCATDVVASRIMGIEAAEVPDIGVARMLGIGTSELKRIKIVGDRIEDVQRRFLRAVPDVTGYSRHDGLSYPVEVYAGGACRGGCWCMAREALDMLTVWCANRKVADERRKKLIYIVGANAVVPDKLPEDAAVFVIGDCAKEHGHRGIFCGGCLCDVGPLYGNIGMKCIGEPVDHPFNSATREHLERYLSK
jgi:uncharacterized protein (DUF362 family)